MLNKEQIEQNKSRYLELINSITLEGANIKGFIDWLNRSDFFEAPASSKYHSNYAGGLCEHSLHVYDALVKLVEQFASHWVTEEFEPDENGNQLSSITLVKNYSEDSLKVVALLHDISKTNFYEQYDRNVKDENGNWTKIKEYKTREVEDRFIYGSHEQNSEFMAHTFFPLSVEEASAILHHHGGMAWDSAQDDVSAIYDRFPLALLLHLADMKATYLDEGHNESNN